MDNLKVESTVDPGLVASAVAVGIASLDDVVTPETKGLNEPTENDEPIALHSQAKVSQLGAVRRGRGAADVPSVAFIMPRSGTVRGSSNGIHL